MAQPYTFDPHRDITKRLNYMRYGVPDSADTSLVSTQTSFHSFSDSEAMADRLQDQDINMEREPSSRLVLLPPELWSRDYLIYCPGVLSEATLANPTRVAELFATTQNSPVLVSSLSTPIASPAPNPLSRPTPPRITPYDGSSINLRPFCSQLLNQIQDAEGYFPTEISKVRFAYQCLGSGALIKMRSSFRCLEDPNVPQEINTLDQFIKAIKQRCQDPALIDKASHAAETIYQGSMSFHDFITVFEDNMADSTYADLDKSQWKAMLKRRLAPELRRALLCAYNVPEEYHAFVAYLRDIDSEIQSIRSSKRPNQTNRQEAPTRTPAVTPIETQKLELTVSQGGTAMDLDTISRCKDENGRLTQEAKDARRKLGRCIRCNKSGHIVINCPLGFKPTSIALADVEMSENNQQLKEQLQ